ncbi:UNVERIFIED_CONTAM: hypothetical protein Sradi_7113900 [Sesamum radiatum]|uniref:DDE Tnp4 domain-containing protein n=1 Tax=Sesamum radiatum TaxID=300843 RepID=A0AAW2J346_SESRA
MVRRLGSVQSKKLHFSCRRSECINGSDNMERFQHSLETINRRFHRVLSALCAMAPELITRPSFTETHARITNNPDFYPFFKDCIGAMDGTLVPAWVPRVDQNRYRSRKAAYVTVEVMVRVVHLITMHIENAGKYYLVDAGFTNYQCFLGPYRGTRYHLPEWRGQGRPYGTPQDMFNHAHSRLRNVIERCFGLLKKRFPILQWGMPSYLLHHQVDIVIACCTLHNFIHKFSNDDLIFNEPDEDTPADMETFYHRGHPTTNELESQRILRDSIAMQMWASNHPN